MFNLRVGFQIYSEPLRLWVLQWWRVFQLGKFGIVVSPTMLLLVVLDLVMSNMFLGLSGFRLVCGLL
jgi:uncharacterized membrane protein